MWSSWLRIKPIVTICVFAVASTTCADDDRPAVVPPLTEAAIEQTLDRVATFELIDRPLVEVAASLESMFGIPIELDVAGLEAAGVDTHEVITGRADAISLRSAIAWMLQTLRLNYVVRDEVLVFTIPDTVEENLRSEVYDVADLLAGAQSRETREFVLDDLVAAILETIAPLTWKLHGGRATIEPDEASGSLVVLQDYHRHREIQRLLTMLRRARLTQDLPGAKPVVLSPDLVAAEIRVAAIERALSRPCTFQCTRMTLREVVAELSRLHHVPIALDHAAMITIGFNDAVAITFNARGATFESALDRMLHELDMTWTIADEMVILTARDEADEFLETRVFPVVDLVREDFASRGEFEAYDRILRTLVEIRTSEKEKRWGHDKGAAAVPSAGAIVVTNTRRTLDQVDRSLNRIREQSRGRGRESAAQPSTDARDRLRIRVYTLNPAPKSGGGGVGIADGRGAGGVQFQVVDRIESIQPGLWSQWFAPRCANCASGNFGEDAPIDAPIDEPAPIPDDPLDAHRRAARQLTDAIPAAIDPETWEVAGGQGTIRAVENSLIVRQTDSIHRRIIKLLTALGYSRGRRGTGQFFEIESLE